MNAQYNYRQTEFSGLLPQKIREVVYEFVRGLQIQDGFVKIHRTVWFDNLIKNRTDDPYLRNIEMKCGMILKRLGEIPDNAVPDAVDLSPKKTKYQERLIEVLPPALRERLIDLLCDGDPNEFIRSDSMLNQAYDIYRILSIREYCDSMPRPTGIMNGAGPLPREMKPGTEETIHLDVPIVL